MRCVQSISCLLFREELTIDSFFLSRELQVSVKRAPGDGPAKVSNSNIQVLRTESEEQWVKMAWHDIGVRSSLSSCLCLAAPQSLMTFS